MRKPTHSGFGVRETAAMTPHEHAQAAIAHIEQAVVGVLAAAGGDGIVPRAEIARRLGIPQTDRGRYWIVSWALFRLHEQGRARQHSSGMGWSAVGSSAG